MDLVEASGEGPIERHPWEVARAAFFVDVLRRNGLPRPGTVVLDVGAGDAWFARKLQGASGAAVICWDTGYEGAVAPRAAEGLRFTSVAPEGRFGLVLALDVAEHVDDDRGFLGAVVREHVEVGGYLLFSVPAWPILFSRHDERLRHRRRYEPAGARSLLEGAGLRVIQGGGLFHGLLLPRAVGKAWEALGGRGGGHAGEWRAPRWVTRAVAAVLSADCAAAAAFASAGWDVPGLSWWALCRRP